MSYDHLTGAHFRISRLLDAARKDYNLEDLCRFIPGHRRKKNMMDRYIHIPPLHRDVCFRGSLLTWKDPREGPLRHLLLAKGFPLSVSAALHFPFFQRGFFLTFSPLDLESILRELVEVKRN